MLSVFAHARKYRPLSRTDYRNAPRTGVGARSDGPGKLEASPRSVHAFGPTLISEPMARQKAAPLIQAQSSRDENYFRQPVILSPLFRTSGPRRLPASEER